MAKFNGVVNFNVGVELNDFEYDAIMEPGEAVLEVEADVRDLFRKWAHFRAQNPDGRFAITLVANHLMDSPPPPTVPGSPIITLVNVESDTIQASLKRYRVPINIRFNGYIPDLTLEVEAPDEQSAEDIAQGFLEDDMMGCLNIDDSYVAENAEFDWDIDEAEEL